MPVNRPTFSESWYRVAALRPRLRPIVQTHRQQHRGRVCHVVHDPSNNNFFTLEAPAFRFVGLLDGRRTVGEVWTLANEQLGDDGPTQNEVIQVLGQLYTNNLLEGDMPADASGLFERYRLRIRREVGGYLMNIMALRFPLLDPDRFLDRWAPVFGAVFSLPGFIAWLAMLLIASSALAGRGQELFVSAGGTLEPSNIFLLYISFSLIKGLHEFGHAFACKRFGLRNHSGGEVHVMGIMLLVLLPMPYVDASSAWAFRSRWQRAIVGCAGMYVEIFAAAICAVIWANTATGTATHAIAYNVMFVSGVSTLLFNANPLLRYDGYYILSDLLEMPNLAQRSTQYLSYLIKRYLYGVRKPSNPANTLGERPWLFLYAVASGIYRVLISVGIILFVADKLFIIGLIMAVGGIIGWVLMPVGNFLHYLFASSDLERVRLRACLLTTAAAVAVVVGVGLVSLPEHQRAEGIVEPRHMAIVYAGTSGIIQNVLPTGARVAANQNLAVSADPQLEMDYKQLLALQGELSARKLLLENVDPAKALEIPHQLTNVANDLTRKQDQIDRLTARAPFAGSWIAPDINEAIGSYRPRGEKLGVVADLHDLLVRVDADQNFGPLIKDASIGVEMRVKDRPEIHWHGVIERIPPSGQKHLSTSAMGWDTGGSIAVDPEDPKGLNATESFFEIWVRPDHPLEGSPLLADHQIVVVRFDLPAKPLIQQWWLGIRRTIQRRFQY